MIADLMVREGSREPITFTLKRGGVPYSLEGKAVRMRRRSWKKIDDHFETTDTSPLLVKTPGTGGVVTFTPEENTWEYMPSAKEYTYLIYFEVEVSSGIWYAWREAVDLRIKVVPGFGDD